MIVYVNKKNSGSPENTFPTPQGACEALAGLRPGPPVIKKIQAARKIHFPYHREACEALAGLRPGPPVIKKIPVVRKIHFQGRGKGRGTYTLNLKFTISPSSII